MPYVLYCSACQLMKLMLFSSLSMLCSKPCVLVSLPSPFAQKSEGAGRRDYLCTTCVYFSLIQPIVAAVWTGFRFHIQFVEVQLEFLQSRGPDDFNHSLALFDILLSEFTFESHSDQSKTVDFTTHSVIGHDTRYNHTNGNTCTCTCTCICSFFNFSCIGG